MQRVLFLDDRSDRIRGAIRLYPPPEYELTFVFTAKECIKKLNYEKWDIVSLDHDLEFEEFVDYSSKSCGMEVVRWLLEAKCYMSFSETKFIVHTTNKPAGMKMATLLEGIGFGFPFYAPWKYTKHITGIVTGAFDLIHPGYVRLFKDAKRICQHLTVALNTNGKRKPFMSVEEKTEILYSIRYVDAVVTYGSEEELDKLIPHYDIKINGSDHQGKTTRPGIDQYYHKRDHDWSTTKLIEKIKELT